MSCKHMEWADARHSATSQLFPRPSFASPHSPPPFCFFRYPWKRSLSSLICPPRLILKHCRGETGTISQQSTNSRVHLGTRSDLVSTFCCSRADINHPAAHSGTCCTLLHLASPRPPRLFPLPWVGFAYSGHFLFFFIQISCHHYNSPRTSSHDCSFYQPHPDPPDVNVSLAASLENCLKMVRSSFFQPSLK